MARILQAIFVSVFLFGGVVLGATDEFQLENGVVGVHKYTPHTRITTVQAWIKTGSVNENPQNNGISHFLEHILFKGTKNFKPDEIDNIVESHGGVMNAGTSKDYTVYYITLPAEHAQVAFRVIADMVFHASFLSDEIEREKPVVVQEIQRKFDNPTFDMWRDGFAALSAETPYAMEIIGTEENVNSFTSEILRQYYNTHYHPHNITLVVVGDISAETTKTLAQKYFNVPAAAKPAVGYNGVWRTTIKESSAKIFERDVAQDYILLGWQVDATAKDSPIYEVLTEMLSGGEYSILNEELKYNRGLVTAVSAGDVLNRSSGGYIVYMVTNPGDAAEAVAAFDEVMKRFMAGGFTDNDLQKALNRLKSRVIFRQERGRSEANEIGYSYTIGLKDFQNTYLTRLDAITREDVVSAAKFIFNSPRIVYKTVPTGGGS